MWGVNRRCKGTTNTLAALRSIRAAGPDGAPVYVILDNLSAHNGHHPNHTVQTRALFAYLRWRNANARHPDVLAAQRRERARIRSEKGLRRGGRPALVA